MYLVPHAFEKLTPGELRLVKDLWRRSGTGGPVTVPGRGRFCVPKLWRRGVVEVWHRAFPGEGLVGPYYRLTLDGCRLASAIYHPLMREAA